MADQALASVVAAPGTLEVQQVPIPDGSADAGLLRVERTGVCGTDVRDLPRGDLPKRIMGHEIVGTVAGLGAQAQRRWGLAEGDRILLEEYLPCGICRACRSGDYPYRGRKGGSTTYGEADSTSWRQDGRTSWKSQGF